MLTIWFFAAIFNVLILFGLYGIFEYLTQIRLGEKQRFSATEGWLIAVLGLLFGTHLLSLLHTKLAGTAALFTLIGGATHAARSYKNLKKTWPILWATLLPTLYIALKLCDAAVPLPHGDPLSYHLRGPLFWVEQRRITFPNEVPTAAICNLVEMLFLLPLEWMKMIPFVDPTSSGVTALRGRLIGQITGQWLSITLGLTSTLFILGQLWKKLEKNFRLKPIKPEILILVLWIVAMAPQTEWLVPLAKNNWLATAFVLCPLALISNPILMGVSFAAAYWAKATNLLVLLPMGLGIGFFFCTEKKTVKKMILFLGGAFLLSLPFLIRNYIWTKNPFYPSELGPFRSVLISQSDRLDISHFFAPFQIPPPAYYWENLVQLLAPFLTEKKIRFISGSIPYLAGVAGTIGFVTVGVFKLQWRKLALLLGATTAATVYWIGIIIGPRFFEPHILPAVLLLRLTGVFLVVWFLNSIFSVSKSPRVQTIFWIFVGATSVNLPIHVLWKDLWPLIKNKVTIEDSVYTMPHGRIYQCIEEKLHSPQIKQYPRIVSDWLNTTYYITGPEIPSTGNVAPLEAELISLHSLNDRLNYLKKQGFEYIWMSYGCDSSHGISWPACSVLGDYTAKDFDSTKIICQEGGTFVLKL